MHKTEYISIYITSILSIVGFLFVLLTRLLFPDLNTNSQTLAVWLTMSSVGYIFSTFDHSRDNQTTLCEIEGFCTSYFSLASVFTTAVVSKNIKNIIRRYDVNPQECRIEVTKHHMIFVWGFPLIFACIPLITNHYGRNDDDIFCWINSNSSSSKHNQIAILEQFLCFYIPFLLILVYNIYVYVVVFKRAQEISMENTHHSKRLFIVVNRIKWYPMVLLVSFIFPAAHRLSDVSKDHHYYWLSIVAATTGTRIEGFLDAIAYGASPSVIRRWSEFMSDVFTLEWECCRSKNYKRNRNYSCHTDPLLFNHVASVTSSQHSNSNSITNSNTNSHTNSNTNPTHSSAIPSSSKGSSYFSYGSKASSGGALSEEDSIDFELYGGVSYPGLFEKFEKNRESGGSLWSQSLGGIDETIVIEHGMRTVKSKT